MSFIATTPELRKVGTDTVVPLTMRNLHTLLADPGALPIAQPAELQSSSVASCIPSGPPLPAPSNPPVAGVARAEDDWAARYSLATRYMKEWNDFVECSQTDARIEVYRKRCYELDPVVNCPDPQDQEALQELRKMAKGLSLLLP